MVTFDTFWCNTWKDKDNWYRYSTWASLMSFQGFEVKRREIVTKRDLVLDNLNDWSMTVAVIKWHRISLGRFFSEQTSPAFRRIGLQAIQKESKLHTYLAASDQYDSILSPSRCDLHWSSMPEIAERRLLGFVIEESREPPVYCLQRCFQGGIPADYPRRERLDFLACFPAPFTLESVDVWHAVWMPMFWTLLILL